MQGCVPCDALTKSLENLDKYAGNLQIIDLTVEDTDELIKSVPTTIFYLDGVEIKREVGYNAYSMLNIVEWLLV
jgi:thiol-disulfide isomerase/thioredoxin